MRVHPVCDDLTLWCYANLFIILLLFNQLMLTYVPGPRVHSSVEGRDTQRFPSVVSNPRRHEPQSPQQVRRRHRRHDDHREPPDDAARPQQQRLLNVLCRMPKNV